MTCRDVQRTLRRRWLAAAGASPDLRDLVPHLERCPACQAESAVWARLYRGLENWEESPPPTLLPGVMAAIATLPPPIGAATTAPTPAWRGLTGTLLAWLAVAGGGSLAAVVWAPDQFAAVLRLVAGVAAGTVWLALRLADAAETLVAAVPRLAAATPALSGAAAALALILPMAVAAAGGRLLRSQR